MTNESEVGGYPSAETSYPLNWWKTVSPQELRSAAAVVAEFLARRGEASPGDEETFARALALQQLLVDETAFVSAADPGVMPSEREEAKEWLAQGTEISKGLYRCLELMRPLECGKLGAAALRFDMDLCLLQADCIRAPFHGGIEKPVVVNRPIEFRNRKV